MEGFLADGGANDQRLALKDRWFRRIPCPPVVLATYYLRKTATRGYTLRATSRRRLDVYLPDLKNQTDDLRLLLVSVEAELSQKREQTELTDTTKA